MTERHTHFCTRSEYYTTSNSVFIAHQHTDARYWYSKSVWLSVCLSVRPSVRNVPVSDENGLSYRQGFSPYSSPIILVLPASNIFTKFWRVIQRQKTRKWYEIELYLQWPTRYSVSKNGLTLKSESGVLQGHWKWRRLQIMCDFLLKVAHDL